MARPSGTPDALLAAYGRALRAHRLRLGLSQVDFGAVAGYHFGYLAAIERGQRNISLRTAEEIAFRLGLDPVRMFAGMPVQIQRRERSTDRTRRCAEDGS